MTRTLVYKRTHHGDPCGNGIFGCCDCMGQVRGWEFEAVIGIGGLGNEAERFEIAGKINWIGIGPEKTERSLPGDYRGPFVRFKHFRDFGTNGEMLCDVAPDLAEEIYAARARFKVRFSREATRQQIEELLAPIKRCRPSRGIWPHRAGCGIESRAICERKPC